MTNVQQIEMFEDLIEKVQNVANAIPPANSVPDVNSTDNKKVLQAYYGDASSNGYGWASMDGILAHMGEPSNGDVIAYNSATEKAEWQAPQGGGGLPDYSQADQGSVLNKQYNGELGWDRPENLLPEGSLLPEITGNDDGKVLTAVYNDKSGSYAQWQTPSGGGGVGSTTYTVNGSDFVQHGSSYTVVFANDYVVDVTSVLSARIYSSGEFSVPCSIIYVDKTGMIAQVTADDYSYISSYNGLTLKIFSVS